VAQPDSRTSVLRKIVLTSMVGGLTFPITNLLFDSTTAQFVAAIGAGAVILVVQFLIDFERRLAAVEDSQREQTGEIQHAVAEGFAKINPATRLYAQLEQAGQQTETIGQLVTAAAAVQGGTSPLLAAFVQVEVARMAHLLRSLQDEEATYGGEDRDWLLALSRSASRTIDAISLPIVDSGRTLPQGGFWNSDLGRRYLAVQREAVRRGVVVRRVFVLERSEVVNNPILRSVCHSQSTLGIDVRVLYPGDMTNFMRGSLHDFILFDNELSYESVPAQLMDEGADPLILYTRLELRPDRIAEQKELYSQLWAAARPYPAIDLPEVTSTDNNTSPGRRR